MRHLRVRNWEKFQHYKYRNPPWIKFHVSLLDDYVLTNLPLHAQLLFDRLLLVAAKTENEFPYEVRWIAETSRLPKRLVEAHLPALVASRLLEERSHGASTPLADRYSQTETVEKSREEAETEGDPARYTEAFKTLAAKVGDVDETSAVVWASIAAAAGLASERAAALAWESLVAAKQRGAVVSEAAYVTGTLKQLASEVAA